MLFLVEVARTARRRFFIGAQARQFGALARGILDLFGLLDLVADLLGEQLLREALARQGARLLRLLLRHFERAAHADGGQGLQVGPLGLFARTLAALLRQVVFEFGQHFAGAALERFAPVFRFRDAPVQFDLARTHGKGAFGMIEFHLAALQGFAFLQCEAAQALARGLLFARDAVPGLLVVQLLELARMRHLHAALVGGQPQGADARAVGVELVVAQGQRVDLHHAQAVVRQQQAQRALQAFVELAAQCGLMGHLAQRTAADEFGGQLAHGG